jgi:hypothetical protein
MLGRTCLAFLWVIQSGTPLHSVFIPTSVALNVAEDVAKGEGYSLANRAKFFLDVMLDKDSKPVYPGYVTVGFYWNSDIVSAISINQETGQVLDIDKCTLFDYPAVHTFQVDLSRATGVPPLSLDVLGKKVGCHSLRRLSVPKKRPGLDRIRRTV